MYIIKSISFWFFAAIIGSISRQVTALECRDYPDPFSHESTKVRCGIVENESYGKFSTNSTGFLSPADAFIIDFYCGSSDLIRCEKAKKVFISAGQRIASVIQFNTPIIVNASFTELSATVLGSAKPSRIVPLQDRDGTVRYYPQALVKQMQFPVHPEFARYDIVALFSSAANIFFKGDSTIQYDQYDFEYIVTHEYMHGLGFVSGWRYYFPEVMALTPYPQFLEGVTDLSQPVEFTGFVEMAFDGYISLTVTEGIIMMTTLVKNMNQFALTGTKFASVQSLLNAFVSSPQYMLGKTLFSKAQTPYTMNFVTNDSTPVVLETKLVPFIDGSSITHVDTKYANTSDFLMGYAAKPGVSFDDLIQKNGNATGGAMGPKLIKVLETLGYTTPDNPSPYRPFMMKSSSAASHSVNVAIDLITVITLSITILFTIF